jgi:hypothetical protein
MTATPPPAPQQGIDPAEALIFVTGLEPFLRHTSRDLGSAIVRSETLPDALEAKIHLFLGRTEPADAADLPPFDFAEVTGLLDAGPAPGDIGKTMAAFGTNHALALDVGQQVTRMAGYLRQQIPRVKHVGLTGPEDLPPPRSEEFRFRRCWRAATDPMSLFDDLQAFAVSREQVKCFTALFPTIARELWPTIQQSLVRKRTQTEGKWKAGRRQEVTLRVLGSQEGPMLTLAHALRPVFAEEQAQQNAQKQAQQQRATSGPSQADESTAVGRLDAAS